MPLRILIVDDSPVMRGFIRRVLELSGLDMACCHEAANGQEALRLLASEPVDVLLSDINMPLMNGEEMLAAMAAHPRLRQIPVVVVSTDSTHNRVLRMMSLGARGYLKKPFQPEELRAEVERVLESCHA
jgi:two-component system chemotaxis response regulator CheY